MGAYDNDPRVRVRDDYFVTVTADDKFDVFAPTSADRWFVIPSMDSHAVRSATLPDRDTYEPWLVERRTGPFPSRDAAIASLIGAPR